MAEAKERIVLVTGGSGLVGHALKQMVSSEEADNGTWIFLSSKDADLS